MWPSLTQSTSASTEAHALQTRVFRIAPSGPVIALFIDRVAFLTVYFAINVRFFPEWNVVDRARWLEANALCWLCEIALLSPFSVVRLSNKKGVRSLTPASLHRLYLALLIWRVFVGDLTTLVFQTKDWHDNPSSAEHIVKFVFILLAWLAVCVKGWFAFHDTETNKI